jgi:hypothetical protein
MDGITLYKETLIAPRIHIERKRAHRQESNCPKINVLELLTPVGETEILKQFAR